MSISTQETKYSTVVAAECSPGFMLPDGNLSVNLQCLNSGLWSGSLPNCQGHIFYFKIIYVNIDGRCTIQLGGKVVVRILNTNIEITLNVNRAGVVITNASIC